MAVAVPEVVNYWRDDRCAKAFWSQKDLPAYQELLTHTADWLAPKSGERWLDLGCGSGVLTRLLWERSAGKLAEIVGLDCAALNAKAYERIREGVQPAPGRKISFVQGDFSAPLPWDGENRFEGVVSGLSIQYAEDFDPITGTWTDRAYDRVLADVHRLLVPGGKFVFSVNVPEPGWGRVAWASLGGIRKARRKGWYLLKSVRMWRYGGWLTRTARTGRFHYLSDTVIRHKLAEAGFENIEMRLSYAKQAYLFRMTKPM